MSNEKKSPPAFLVWMSENSRTVSIIVFIIFAVFAFLAVIFPVRLQDNDRKVKSYTPVSAAIDSAQVYNYTGGGRYNGGVVGTINNINVHYDVDGITYTAYFSGYDAGKSGLHEGGSITVYYNPDNPSDAVVENSPRVIMNTVLFTVIFALVAVFSFTAGVNIRKNGIKIHMINTQDWSKSTEDNPVHRNTIEYYKSPDESDYDL